jgi:hypothetical protein
MATPLSESLHQAVLAEMSPPAMLSKLKAAATKADSFFDVAPHLKKAGVKFKYLSDPYPLYLVNLGWHIFVMVHKDFAQNPDHVVNDIAIGALAESI